MKLAILLYGIPQNGGTKVLFHVGNLLRERGHEVVYFVAEREKELPFPSGCECRFANRDYRNAIGRVRWLATQHLRADVALATAHPTAFALHCNPSPVKRKMYYVQAYEPEFYSDSFGHLLRRWPMMLAAGASYLLPLEKIVNCHGSRRGLTQKDRSQAPEISPGIDLSLYHPRPRHNRKITIGHICRREHWKGSDQFFRAMVELRDRGWDFDVRVAYDLWPKKHGLIYDAVIPRNEQELAEYYSSVDILVSTVTQKGFGFPPLEAMSSGTLCLSTPMDFGRPGMDHLPVLSHSPMSIVRQVEKAFRTKPWTPWIEAGLETARAYDWKHIADRWCEVLGDGLSN